MNPSEKPEASNDLSVTTGSTEVELHVWDWQTWAQCPKCDGELNERTPLKYRSHRSPFVMRQGPFCPHCGVGVNVIMHLSNTAIRHGEDGSRQTRET